MWVSQQLNVCSLHCRLVGGQRPTDLLVPTNHIRSLTGHQVSVVSGAPEASCWPSVEDTAAHPLVPLYNGRRVHFSPSVLPREDTCSTVGVRLELRISFLPPYLSFLLFLSLIFFLKLTICLTSAKEDQGKGCAHTEVRNHTQCPVPVKGSIKTPLKWKVPHPPRRQSSERIHFLD